MKNVILPMNYYPLSMKWEDRWRQQMKGNTRITWEKLLEDEREEECMLSNRCDIRRTRQCFRCRRWGHVKIQCQGKRFRNRKKRIQGCAKDKCTEIVNRVNIRSEKGTLASMNKDKDILIQKEEEELLGGMRGEWDMGYVMSHLEEMTLLEEEDEDYIH
ncbi:unnamed protein product [Gordionus sp. m RMFG-2023]